jgi:predicted metalloprotease with PDZ domain
VYSTGLALFVVGDEGETEVSVEVPRGWQFASPWEPVGRGRYRAVNHAALIDNTFVVGKSAVQAFTAGQFTVEVALLGQPASSAQALQSAFSRVAPRLVQIFGDDRKGRYMIVLIRGPEDGESYESSFAVATENAPTATNRIIWANHLSHELTHYWIGTSIAPTDDDDAKYKWFTEGFTEYTANLALFEVGVYSRADFESRMVRHFGTYLLTRENPLFMKTSLEAAGEHQWQNRPLIYSGGATLAFCLDSQIRRASRGQRTIADLLRRLFARSQKGEHFTSDAFVAETSKLTGVPMNKFYSDFVEGTKVLPIEECAVARNMTVLVHGYDVFVVDGGPNGPH